MLGVAGIPSSNHLRWPITAMPDPIEECELSYNVFINKILPRTSLFVSFYLNSRTMRYDLIIANTRYL